MTCSATADAPRRPRRPRGLTPTFAHHAFGDVEAPFLLVELLKWSNRDFQPLAHLILSTINDPLQNLPSEDKLS
jgi:hypothetical protein